MMNQGVSSFTLEEGSPMLLAEAVDPMQNFCPFFDHWLAFLNHWWGGKNSLVVSNGQHCPFSIVLKQMPIRAAALRSENITALVLLQQQDQCLRCIGTGVI